jgi:hypothetical protein
MVHSSNRLWYLKLTLSQNWRRWEQITVTVVGRELANNVNRELVNCRYQTYCLPVLELRFPPGQRTSYFKTSVQKIYICIYILNVCRYFLPAFLLLTRGGTSVWAHCRTGLTKQIFFVHVQVPNIRWEERKKKKKLGCIKVERLTSSFVVNLRTMHWPGLKRTVQRPDVTRTSLVRAGEVRRRSCHVHHDVEQLWKDLLIYVQPSFKLEEK